VKGFPRLLLAVLLCPLLLCAEVMRTEPVVVLGGGIGGLTSAIYLGRAGLSPIVIEGKIPGGLLTQSHMVQNWPGELEISGMELTDKIRAQAIANGAQMLNAEVIGVDFSKRPLIITTRSLDGSDEELKIRAESCIIAMGTQPNYLGVKGEQEFWGKGVSNCAVCDGSLYKDQVVAVVGGGDAAILEALYLSNIARQVYIFVRKSSLRAVEEKRVRLLKQTKNVQFVFNTTVEEIKGEDDQVTSVVIKENGKKKELAIDGLFLAIGSTPNSKIFEKSLKLDRRGYIVLTKDQQTSVRGVYAIGDIVDPVYKQAISAAGDGSKAALQAQEYVSDKIEPLAPVAKEKQRKNKYSKEIIEITSKDQLEKAIHLGDLPVAVDFYATWCPPCKKVAPVIEKFAASLSGKVKFYKVNVDRMPDLTVKYQIQAMPTVILFDESGAEVDRRVGPEEITNLLKQLEEA
jgi:thioredoxin reductase (NADPH)